MKIEVLKSKQQEILPWLKEFKDFYLVGGTALALQMGHRVSIDFDLFTENDLSAGLLSKIKRVFRGRKVAVSIRLPEQLTVKVDDLKIDFVSHKFAFILPPLEFKKVKIAQIPEIAAMKAFALNFRGSNKDYIDLYFILKEKHSSLQEIVEIGERKYGNEFNFRLFLEQLLYLDGLKRVEIEFLRERVSEKQMIDFFAKEIKNLKL